MNKENKTENIKKNNKQTEFIRVSIELEKSEIYLLAIDVPLNEDNKDDDKKINLQAINIAWNVINEKKIDINKAFIGSSFSNKILGRKKLI